VHGEKMNAPQTKGKVIRWARWYDLSSKLLTFGRDKAIRKKALELAAIRPGEKVLDVGCGTGTLAIGASDLTGETGEVHGVDPSPEMIDVAQRKAARSGRRVRFETGVIEALPYPDGEFDLVLSRGGDFSGVYVIDHLGRKATALQFGSRGLTPNVETSTILFGPISADSHDLILYFFDLPPLDLGQ